MVGGAGRTTPALAGAAADRAAAARAAPRAARRAAPGRAAADGVAADGTVDVSAVLRALAEPRREELARALASKQLTARELMAATGLSQPLLSHHLKVLREARLVESTLCGRYTVYRLRAATLGDLSARLAALAQAATVTQQQPAC